MKNNNYLKIIIFSIKNMNNNIFIFYYLFLLAKDIKFYNYN